MFGEVMFRGGKAKSVIFLLLEIYALVKSSGLTMVFVIYLGEKSVYYVICIDLETMILCFHNIVLVIESYGVIIIIIIILRLISTKLQAQRYCKRK